MSESAPPFDPEVAMANFQKQVEAAMPHCAHLKKAVGVWDMAMKMYCGPEPSHSKGVETVTMLGEFWLLAGVESEAMGQPFRGHCVTGYDMVKKKFISMWVDTMAPYAMHFEGGLNAAGDTLTLECTMPDPMMGGAQARYVIVDRWTGPHTREFSMVQHSVMGEMRMMETQYTRRK
jgi:hypothetical protein